MGQNRVKSRATRDLRHNMAENRVKSRKGRGEPGPPGPKQGPPGSGKGSRQAQNKKPELRGVPVLYTNRCGKLTALPEDEAAEHR